MIGARDGHGCRDALKRSQDQEPVFVVNCQTGKTFVSGTLCYRFPEVRTKRTDEEEDGQCDETSFKHQLGRIQVGQSTSE